MRERLLMDRGWRFALGHAADESRDFDFRRSRCTVKAGEGRGAAKPDFDDSTWAAIDLPHDWAIDLPLVTEDHPRFEDREINEHGFRQIGPDFPEHSVGWYRKRFDIPAEDLGRRISIEFDGVFRDSVVWVNGFRLGRHESGYTAFRYDLTDFLNYGGSNVITVRAEASSYEGWWYEGAGIYRHVWLLKTSPIHIAPDGVQVISEPTDGGGAVVTVRTTVVNESDRAAEVLLRSAVESVTDELAISIDAWGTAEVEQQVPLTDARLWSVGSPELYQLQSSIEEQGPAGSSPSKERLGEGEPPERQQVDDSTVHPHPSPLPHSERGPDDAIVTQFGIRTLRWDADKGFFLNGKPVKIKGTCNHQHHAGVGVAIPDSLHEWKLWKLKKMGSNAYRCAHYMVTPELLDACDRVGMLVMCENRLAGGSDEYLEQLRTQVRRDRNHPSIILWSLANEEHTVQWAIAGERIGKSMVRAIRALDPTRKITSAMHDRGFTEGFMNVVDVQGWNYMKVGSLEKFHERMPDQPIIGSEESSAVTTRGQYVDDKERGYVRSYDGRVPGWGTSAEKWWTYFAEREWLAGAFVWTGYDYFGEPIPYKWPCTSSHFGLMDLCGFPKDLFYYYKSWWSDEPVLHLFPHWTWPGREGEAIEVWCYTNHDEVELFVNRASAGRVAVARNSHAEWKVKYAPGVIEVRAYRGGKQVASSRVETAGMAARLVLRPEAINLRADGEDVTQVDVAVVDAAGRAVPGANDLIHFDVTGPARLLGVGNGDPSSHELHQAPHRRAFNGLAAVLVKASREPGAVRVTARAEGLEPAVVELRLVETPPRASV